MKRRLAAALVGVTALLGACSDPESVGDALDRSERGADGADDGDPTTTSTPAADPVDPLLVEFDIPGGGHRYRVDLIDLEGEVESPDRHRSTVVDGELVTETIVVDSAAYVRNGTVDAIDETPFAEVDVDDVTAEGALAELEGRLAAGDKLDAGDVNGTIFGRAVELATLDPGAFAAAVVHSPGAQAQDDGDGVVVATPELLVPDTEGLVAAVDDVEAIIAELSVDEDGVITDIFLASVLTFAGVVVDLEFTTVPPVTPPAPELLDPTPAVEEEELAVFADTPLVAPALPPEGTALRGIRVLAAEETVEGCPQVELTYGDDSGGEPLVIYLLPQSCALAFDPTTPFSETFGGLPARLDGREVLVGTTVVQLTGTLTDEQSAVVAASLQPTTPDALLAAVVPLPD